MSIAALFLIVLVMFVGLTGVLIPIIPGVALIWAAGLVWVLQTEGTLRWVVLALMSVLALVGGLAQYFVATKRITAEGGTKRTLMMGLLGCIVGFFILPVVGVLVGGVVGVYIGEWVRLQSPSRAWWAAWRLIVSLGWGILIEFAAAVTMIAVWASAAFGQYLLG